MGFQYWIDRLYYEETIHELAMRNQPANEKLSYNSIMYIDAVRYLPQCTVSKLAERLHISKPAVTMKINELMRQGLIEKEQSQEDKRVFYLRPALYSEELFPEYEAALRKTEEYLTETYSREELEIFEKILADASETYIKELKNSEQFDY